MKLTLPQARASSVLRHPEEFRLGPIAVEAHSMPIQDTLRERFAYPGRYPPEFLSVLLPTHTRSFSPRFLCTRPGSRAPRQSRSLPAFSACTSYERFIGLFGADLVGVTPATEPRARRRRSRRWAFPLDRRIGRGQRSLRGGQAQETPGSSDPTAETWSTDVGSSSPAQEEPMRQGDCRP